MENTGRRGEEDDSRAISEATIKNASPAKRTDPSFVRELFRETAPYYDTVNQLFSLGSGSWYRRRCLVRAGLKPGDRVLDVAIGTGLIASSALRIVGLQGAVFGLDLSEAMLDEARRKLDIPLVQGLAEALPFADNAIDFLVMGYAIRHITALDKCLLEFCRVVKPGGTILLLEVSSPSRTIYRTTLARYLGRGVPYLSYLITREPKVRTLMAYHWETMKDCLSPSTIVGSMKSAGLKHVVCEGWFDLFRSYAGRKSES